MTFMVNGALIPEGRLKERSKRFGGPVVRLYVSGPKNGTDSCAIVKEGKRYVI
ncbi:MAG: hypothetical protein HZA13_07580 [Nitrospirae bacterium]|nr:hypothetical protein [Nitrospirota bacterium]